MPNVASYRHLKGESTHYQKEAFVSFESILTGFPIYLFGGSAALLHR